MQSVGRLIPPDEPPWLTNSLAVGVAVKPFARGGVRARTFDPFRLAGVSFGYPGALVVRRVGLVPGRNQDAVSGRIARQESLWIPL